MEYEIFSGQGRKKGRKRGGSQGRQGVTQPFFELQTPDFAWNFVWTVSTNYEIFFGQGRQYLCYPNSCYSHYSYYCYYYYIPN